MGQFLPSEEVREKTITPLPGGGVTIDLTALERLGGTEAEIFDRFLRAVQIMRQDFTARCSPFGETISGCWPSCSNRTRGLSPSASWPSAWPRASEAGPLPPSGCRGPRRYTPIPRAPPTRLPVTQASPTEARLRVPGDRIAGLLGERDSLLRLVEQGFPRARIVARGDELRISADERTAGMVQKVFEELLVLLAEGQRLDEDRVRRVVDLVKTAVPSPPACSPTGCRWDGGRWCALRASIRSATWMPSGPTR